MKPQNFVVKFDVGHYDLVNVRVALTDFGSAGSQSKGGTPIFASPECFEETDFRSDIFSLGRLFLYLIVPKDDFLKLLFIPITNYSDREDIINRRSSRSYPQILKLIDRMLLIKGRIDIDEVRKQFNLLSINKNIRSPRNELLWFLDICDKNKNSHTECYIEDLRIT